ncbi:MAG TPA: DUF4430 domain-containing protein [Candidatus Nanopelagicaceae bacterium]|nr:DUF4430 domain-containing protein [Candidatus Nanopelagicaceae bacterium]
MRKKVKITLIIIVGVSLLTSLLIFNLSLYKKPETLESVNNLSLTVDFNNGTVKTRLNFTLDNGKTTALDALDMWCEIDYDDFGWGIIVREIDKVRGFWIYKINGLSPSVGASVYSLKDGDLIEWQRV